MTAIYNGLDLAIKVMLVSVSGRVHVQEMGARQWMHRRYRSVTVSTCA